MTEETNGVAAEQKTTKLPRRDWILLPAVGLLAIASVAGGVELVSQLKYPTKFQGSCTVFQDPVAGPHGKPNCIAFVQDAGTELTEYRFNDCGFRTDLPCGPKPRGTFRIVMIGTSMAGGWSVPVEKTLANLLPEKLTQITGRNIQLYNEAFPYRYPDFTAEHFDEVLKAQPDMILWALNSSDLQRQSNAPIPQDRAAGERSFRQKVLSDLKDAFVKGTISQSVTSLFTHTRTYNLLAEFIYASPSQYLRVTLAHPDRFTGYLKIEPSELWLQRYRDFNEDFGRVAAQAQAAGVPLVVTFLPNRGEAAMIALGTPTAGYDPYLIDTRLRSIVTGHGATYVAISSDMRNYPNPQRGYYATEGHANARGNALFAEILARKLTSEVSTDLRANNQTHGSGKVR